MKNYLLFLNIVILSIGRCGGPLISRLYFLHGGQRIWMSSWLKTVGCPIILIPLAIAYFQRRKIDPQIIFITPFTTLLAVLLVKQKLTAYSAISVALLIATAAILVLRTTDDDLPAGKSTMDYMMGFFMSVIGAILYGLLLPLIKMIYINAKKAITYTTVLEIQMIIAIFATAFSTVGVIINKDFQANFLGINEIIINNLFKFEQAIQEEASQFDIGEVKYYLVLVCCAIIWQFTLLGIVGVICYSSSLLSGIISAFLLPITEVLAVILFHEKFQIEKGIAIFLAICGFISYFYGENEQIKKEKQKTIDEDQSQPFLLQLELSM
ncbi:hypothetical protein H5410_023311 [Solanum commersonii]|uniref:Probable purine permease n=1 Tax=Solanum commersonii TaxID=4109 RepID=A0A9J5ZK06_SOLCO|nr:hypothetical protein H5410_023311 [Solanum commersonii]